MKRILDLMEKMKRWAGKLAGSVAGAAAMLILSAVCARGQTVTATNAQSWFQQMVSQGSAWLTSPDTNNTTLESAKLRLETGPDVQSGVTVSDDVFIQYNLALSNRLGAVSETRTGSVGGTVIDQEVGIGYNVYQQYDTEITAYAMGGYRFDLSHDVFTVGAEVRHMLNKNMYVAPSVELDFGKKATPRFRAGVGWAF